MHPPDFEVQVNRCLTRIPCADDATNRIEVWAKGDGDCLFHSLTYLLQTATLRAVGRTQTELRGETVTLLRTWFGTVADPGIARDWVKGQLVLNGEPGIAAGTTGADLQTAVTAYFDRMARPGTYGDPLCIAAIEDLYDVTIKAYNREGAIILPATNDGGVQTLRIAYVSYWGGGNPNHFNPMVPDTGQVVQPVIAFEPHAIGIELGALPSDANGARPYAPPIRHTDFPALPAIATSTSVGLGVRSLFVSFGGQNVVQLGGPVFLTFGLSWQPPKGSAVKAPDPIAADTGTATDYGHKERSVRLFRPRLTAPLRAGKEGLTTAVDTEALDLQLMLSGAYADTTPLQLQLEGRTGAHFVARRIAFTWGDLGKDVQSNQGVALRQTTIAALDKSNVLFADLSFEASPYRLSIWSSEAGNRTIAACVYFNVPALDDVVGIAQVANMRAVLLGDLLRPLAALDITGAAIGALGETPRPKLTDAVADRISEELKRFKVSGGKGFDPNPTTIVLPGKGGTFVQTSWASFAVIRHDKGRYFLRWVGATGGRNCYIANVGADAVELLAPPYFNLKAPNYFDKEFAVQQWRVFDFAGFELPEVTGVVTTGISSCAGGLTWPAADPDFYILWHFDAGVSVVVQQLAGLIWKEVPNLNTIASVFPQPEEIRKYRNAVLYPEAVAKTSVSRFLVRGSHLGSLNFATGCGHNEFGVLFEKGLPVLTGTYGFDKRTWTVKGAARPGDREQFDYDSYCEHAAFDYAANIFEEYRHDGKTPQNGPALKDYSDLHRSPKGIQAILTETRKSESIYRLPVAETWAALDGARPLGEQPLFYVGTKGTLELNKSRVSLAKEAVPPKKEEASSK